MATQHSPTDGNAQSPRSKTSRRTGFTLIELLVVVAIIALLISILLPSLRAARDTSKKAKCMANLRSIGLALFMYADDHRQQLPGYDTMGKHGYRIAPGQQLRMPVPGGSSLSPFPECWGIQAVLHTGSSPRILPNGAAIGKDCSRPLYHPADSPAWRCPANPGPSDRTDWQDWGNGYAYRCNSGQDDPATKNKIYNLDYLAMNRAQWNSPLVWDNYLWYPGDPGFNGPFERYTVNEKFQRPPHRIPSMTGTSACWIGFFVDGHCQLNGFNH